MGRAQHHQGPPVVNVEEAVQGAAGRSKADEKKTKGMGLTRGKI